MQMWHVPQNSLYKGNDILFKKKHRYSICERRKAVFTLGVENYHNETTEPEPMCHGIVTFSMIKKTITITW